MRNRRLPPYGTDGAFVIHFALYKRFDAFRHTDAATVRLLKTLRKSFLR